MRGMILRPVLLCLGTVLAFPTLEPHLPQTIDCPHSDIHVYVNHTAVDRKEYTFVDWNAANLQDCVEKCFGNHFCYSIRFDASLDHNCGLYYFAAYNCSNQALTKASTIDYKGGSITLDCIRCPGRGEFVTAPPFSSIGEQTIVSETAVLARGKNIKGTATEITHNSEHEGKTHGEVEGATNEGVKGAIEGSGETVERPGAPSETGAAKTGEEPSASTETTLTGTEGEGSTAVPSAESSDATTAAPEGEEAGSTTAPGTGAEAGAEEPSTVDGSGEGAEATTPITGEPELIGESSGEGPSAAGGESSSRAPGIKPTESHVEGSGVEGSGEAPEIGHQEEEEPVKVEVETTTAWSGHTEQPRVCSGSLRFVPSSTVDLDTVQLLINSTKANSPAECAKICYEHNCGFAYYEPSTFICQFMANTEDVVDSSTCPSDHADAKYQAEFRTDVASTMTCVVCAKESEVVQEKPALQPIASPRRGSYPACIISFQAAEGDHSSFPFYKSIQVKGLNECARHCFIGECSQSVYNPKTKECRLGSNPKDTCTNLPLIQKVTAPSEEVLLQCFRCIPEDLIGVKGTVSETTGYREPPTAAESIDEAAATANREKEQHAAAAAATTPEPEAATEAATEAVTEAATEAATEAETEAAITEAATEETTAAATEAETEAVTEAVTEASTEAATEAVTEAASTEVAIEETTAAVTTPEPAAATEAATEANTEVVTEAATEAATETVTEAAVTESATEETTAAATEATTEAVTEAATEAATTEAAPEETTTIAGSGSEVELTEPLPEGVTEAPEETTTATESTTTEQETTPIGGKEVELEEASGEEETTTASGAVATTPSGYDSTTGSASGVTAAAEGEEATTVEGSGEEEAAASTAAAHAVGADYEATTAAGAAAATTEAAEETTAAAGEEAATTSATGEETTAAAEEATTAEGGEEAATTEAGEEETTAASAAEGEEATTAGGEEGATTAAAEGESTLSPEEAATTEAGAGESTLSPEEAATSEGPGEMSKAIEANDQPLILASEDLDFGKSCVIKFQSAPFSDRPSTLTAPFEKAFHVDTIELCATRCFQDGCSSAKFEPETKTCHLAYEDKQTCDRSELHLQMKEVTGDTWIHCVNCYPEKSVVKDVLGAAANKTEGEEGEKSMLDKVVGAVSDVAHTVASKVTGENPDMVLKHGCIVNFQTSLSAEMAEKVEYLPPFKTRYAHRCATKCFQEGCAAATFNPTTNECSLGYGRFVKCSNSPLLTTALDIKETITIHCMSCIHHKSGDGGVDLVVLSPDDARIHVSESQDIPAEVAEGSGTEEAIAAPGAEATTEGAEVTTAASEEGTTVSATEEEGTTVAGEEAGSTVSGTEGEATTVAGEGAATTVAEEGEGVETTIAAKEEGAETTVAGAEEATTVSAEGEGAETTVAGEEGLTTASSVESTTVYGEESSTTSSLEGSGEVNGGSLGEEGSGALEGPGKGRISEVPLETSVDGVKLPAGVEEGEVEGKVQVSGEKGEEGKFKPELPAGFSIDSGLGRVQVDGKMPEGGKTAAGEEEKGSATGTAGSGEKPAEAKTGAGTEAGAGEKAAEIGESTESPAEGTTSSEGQVSSTGEAMAEGTTSGEGAESSTEPTTAESTEEGIEAATGLTTGEEATTASTEEASSAAAAPSESTIAPGETSESSTAAGETSESSTAAGETAESSTSAGESTAAPGEETTTGHGIIHPAKEFEHTPLHPEGEEVEVGSAETTTGKEEEGAVTAASKDVEATTAGEETSTGKAEEGVTSASKESDATTTAAAAETTTEEEGPAFVQESPSEAEEKEEGLAIANDDLKHREGLLEKALATGKPTVAGESTTGATVSAEKPAAAESIDTGSTAAPSTEEEEAVKGTVAPVESTTGATHAVTEAAESSTAEPTTVAAPAATEAAAESSTAEATTVSAASSEAPSGGEIEAMAAQDATASQATTEEKTTAATSIGESTAAPTTAASTDLQHREGILEKALATAHPAATTKEGAVGETSTPSAESSDTSSSTAEPTIESTVAASTESAPTEGAETTVAASTEGSVATEESTVASSTEGTVSEGETTVAASTEGSVATEGGESTEAPTAEATSSEGESTVAPVHGMAASVDEKTKEEAKEVEEEMATKGEVKQTGEKGVAAASTDAGTSTVAPSETTAWTSAPAVLTSTVPSPADLAKVQHHEKGGAEFGQAGQRGSEEEVNEEPAHKGEVKGSGAKGAGTASSLDTSSTVAPSDTEGAAAAAESDAATGELTTSSSVDGGAGGLAREEATESTTSAAEESTAESTTGATEGTTAAASEEPAESSTSPSEEAASSTISASESHDTTPSIDSEKLIQKALATGAPKISEEHISTPAVPSPADLAKVQHHEKGGAEFGQTGQRGSEEKIGEQEDEIHSSTIAPVEASTTTGESLDTGVDHALSAIGEKTTTEPPVQAVKDLLDALASGDFDRALLGKKNGTEAAQLLKGKTQITEQATPINQKHEGQTFFEHDHNVDITTLHAIDDSIVTVPSPQGISKECDGGRIEFQFVPAGSLPRLNVTNDVPARTPADCARKCHETKGCRTAGFIPTPSADIANGVCLLTSDDEVCISREDAVPQHASVTAFVISCIRCTRCSYTLSHMTLSSSTAKFQHISTVKTIGECAEVCHDKKCVFAQYDATTNTCALSLEASHESGCSKVEPPIAVKGAYPVRLECVQCRD